MSEETPEPYQITALKKLARNYSHEHFRSVVKECRDVIALTIMEDNSSNQQKARVFVLRYLDGQLQRAMNWVGLEADLMALVLRNQTELRFWASYISKGEAEATKFLEDAEIDARELYERMQKVMPDDEETTEVPEPPVGKLTRVTRRDENEEFIFKLCSKLIHPTSLALTRPELVLLEPMYQQYLALEVARHGWGILSMFHRLEWEE